VTGASTVLDELCLADHLPPTYLRDNIVVEAPAPTATQPEPSVQTPTGGPMPEAPVVETPSTPGAPKGEVPSTQSDESEAGSGVGLSAVDDDSKGDEGCALPAQHRAASRSWLWLLLAACGLLSWLRLHRGKNWSRVNPT
jgi:hypothetical protein